jgi:hypothetical protein
MKFECRSLRPLVLVVLFGAGSTWAQPQVLLEACAALPDPTKRLECLRLVVGRAEREPLAQLKETTIGVQSGLTANLSYSQYESLSLQFIRQLALYKATQPPSEISTLLDEAAVAYEDAKSFWLRSRGYLTRYDRLLDVDDMKRIGMDSFVWKYSIPITVQNGLSWIRPESALRAMWSYAEGRTTKAFQLAEGK